MTEPLNTPRASRLRARTWILTLSLAANVLVAGVGLGTWLRHSGPPPEPPQAERRLGFGQWAAGLEREDHRALRQAFEARGMDFRGLRQAEMADRRALLEVLQKVPFDAVAFAEITDRITARAMDRMSLGNELIRDHVIAMDDARRRAFAERLEVAVKKSEAPPRPRAERQGTAQD